MDHSETVIIQTDEELLFCIQNLPIELTWENIILKKSEDGFLIIKEKYDSFEGKSVFEICGGYETRNEATSAFEKERLSLIFRLMEAKVISTDDDGNLVSREVKQAI